MAFRVLDRQATPLTSIVIIGLLLSCAAKTSISSRTNPSFANRAFSKLFVLTTFHDIELEEAFEIKLRSSLQSHEVDCVFENEVFFAGDWEIDELIDAVDSADASAILMISPEESGVSQQYIPRSSTAVTKGKGRVDEYGNISYTSKSRTTEYGGYNIDKPWAQFSATLFDVKTGEKVWYATARTGGNAFAKWKTVARSMAGKTVVQLAKDGITPD